MADYEKIYKSSIESADKINALTKLVDSYKAMEDTITLHLQVLTFIMKNMKFIRQKVMQKEGGIVKNE